MFFTAIERWWTSATPFRKADASPWPCERFESVTNQFTLKQDRSQTGNSANHFIPVPMVLAGHGRSGCRFGTYPRRSNTNASSSRQRTQHLCAPFPPADMMGEGKWEGTVDGRPLVRSISAVQLRKLSFEYSRSSLRLPQFCTRCASARPGQARAIRLSEPTGPFRPVFRVFNYLQFQ